MEVGRRLTGRRHAAESHGQTLTVRVQLSEIGVAGLAFGSSAGGLVSGLALKFIDEPEGAVAAVHSRLRRAHHLLLQVPLSPLRFAQPAVVVIVVVSAELPSFGPEVVLLVVVKRVVGFRVGHLWGKDIHI
ncbi:hypothetical protein EYF80_010459 [Liparis tanakae]|uniref:Uncharacterized protein n=1 Tax=Liparis tanakae TaxID=230148 RepID=A0A4Z2IMX9_9TELE|nr:hypothetical protein EYF80_010459 [Liparis tanakae]